MNKMNIIVDSCCDLSAEMQRNMQAKVAPLTITIDSTEYVDDGSVQIVPYLNAMKASPRPARSACPSPALYMQEMLDNPGDCFVLTLSSKLSGSYNAAMLGRQMALEEEPDKHIHVFDSESACAGETYLAMLLQDLITAGHSFEGIISAMNDKIRGLHTLFVLDSLDNLVKNGRMKKAAAAIANVLSIRPVLSDDGEGGIKLIGKGRGTRGALQQMIDVADATGMLLTVHQNRRWDEDFVCARKVVDAGTLGPVFRVESAVLGCRGIPGDWRGVKAYGGGMMLDWGVHIIDRIVKMVPEKITKIYCDLSYITNPECDDGIQVTLTFESGLRVNLEVGTCHFVNEPLWCVYGDMGSAEILNWKLEGRMVRLTSWDEKDTTPILAGAGLTKTMAPREHGKSVEELPLPRFEFDHNALYRNFAETCTGDAEQIVTQEHALRVLRVMEACFKSYETGETVKFEA